MPDVSVQKFKGKSSKPNMRTLLQKRAEETPPITVDFGNENIDPLWPSLPYPNAGAAKELYGTTCKDLNSKMNDFKLKGKVHKSVPTQSCVIDYFRKHYGYRNVEDPILATAATRAQLVIPRASDNWVLEVRIKMADDRRAYFVTGPKSAQWHVPLLLMAHKTVGFSLPNP